MAKQVRVVVSKDGPVHGDGRTAAVVADHRQR